MSETRTWAQGYDEGWADAHKKFGPELVKLREERDIALEEEAKAQAEWRRLGAENARLREALVRARDDMEGWGQYADAYFQEKWDLDGDLKAIDDALKETADG